MNATLVHDAVRTVTLVKCGGFDEAIDASGDLREVHKAIGYLSQWALHTDGQPVRQCKCRITMAQDGNIYAAYRDKDDNITYEIGAILREGGTYSFHS